MKRCDICPNNCLIEKSICGRKCNIDENVVETTGVAIDPVEKKPLYHYKPGSKTLSVGTLGCNLKCLNCQNHEIAQPENPSNVYTRTFSPEDLVDIALSNNLDSISWTYNEPTIYPEWIISTAKIAEEHDINIILVTNGYTSDKTLKQLVKHVDAVNIDLKSSKDSFYSYVCKGNLDSITNSLKYYYENEVHVEVTTLLIPEYNTDIESIMGVIDIVRDVSVDIPLHFSAFYPQFKLKDVPQTDYTVVFNSCQLAIDNGLNYVYSGNTPSSRFDNTYCKNCGKKVIKRDYYSIEDLSVNGGCPECGNIFLKY